MRAVVQRVAEARVRVDGHVAGEIGHGLVVLVGIARDDDAVDVRYLAAKLPVLRLFDGPDGRAMDRSVKDVAGSVLIVSQFTLYGDTRGQRRPSFTEAAPAIDARPLYEALVEELRASGISVETGEFQSVMRVELVNDGPVTVLVDSRKS